MHLKKKIKAERSETLKYIAQEFQNYHLKVVETNYYLYKVFNKIKTRLRNLREKWTRDEDESVAASTLSKNDGIMLMVDNLEQTFHHIYSTLSPISMRRKLLNEELSDFDENYIKSTLRSLRELRLHFEKIFLAKKLINTYYHELEPELGTVYRQVVYRIARDSRSRSYFLTKKFEEKIKLQTCLNLDTGVISATQPLSRFKMLTDKIISLQDQDSPSKNYLNNFSQLLGSDLHEIDHKTDCLGLYFEIYQYITQHKFKRIKKFLTDNDFKRRKYYLRFRLQHSLSTDNHSDPIKDNDLAIFLQDKARKSEGEEAEVYSGFTQRKKILSC